MARKASVSVTWMTLVAALVAALAIGWPVIARVFPVQSSTGPDPVTITSYQGDFRVDEDGKLTATETVQADFPCCRHGIFRFFDVTVPWGDNRARLIPKDISVSLDGGPVPVAYSWENGRRYRVAKIGDPNRTLAPGAHTYVISYTVDGVLAPTSAGAIQGESSSWAGDSESSVFYWNVVAGGWQMSMGATQSRVTLPTDAGEVKCTYGWDSRGECQISGVGTDSIQIRTGALGPRIPVTIRATQTLPPAQFRLPWTATYDGILGHSLPAALIVGLLGLAGLVVGRLWEVRSRERPPGYPVMYEPPPGLGPTQTYFVMHEQIPATALTATLLYQAEQGLTQLTQVSGKDWLVEGKGGDWSAVDPVTRAIGEELGITTAGSAFHANGTISAGQTLSKAKGKISTVTKSWASQAGLVSSSGFERLGQLAVLGAIVMTGILVFWPAGGITLWAIPFAGFAVGGIGLLRGGVGSRRTTAGRDQWSRAGGFYRLLSTPSAEDRFDFSAIKELYTAFIPFAVAFGCADKWARKYQVATGEDPPTPVWYVGPGVSSGFWGTSTGFESFESSLQSSIGAYQASQSSSSSGGGGGFSGGGGGGGGGGGSW
ncbi:MAG: DUF2207 domain-containing protein [Nocardioidaceae bacterium]|nr:MAG: DUF2207 domain-containing protein [Nocardioidaceae bacterium]